MWCFVRGGSSDFRLSIIVSDFSVLIACRGVEVTCAALATVHVGVVATSNVLFGNDEPGCL